MTNSNDMPRAAEDELALARLALARRFRSLASRTHNMDASAIVCFHKYLDDAREELRAEGRAQ